MTNKEFLDKEGLTYYHNQIKEQLKDEVIISSETPAEGSIWINPEDPSGTIGSEVVNSLDGEEIDKAPSVKVVKENLNKLNDVAIGLEPNNAKVWVEYENLVNETTWQQGAIVYDTGAETSLTTRIRTDYIPISPNTVYKLKIRKGYMVLAFEYDSSKVYVKPDFDAFFSGEKTLITTSNTSFIRLSVMKDDRTDISPSEANNMHAYLSHIDPSIKANINGSYETISYKNIYSEGEVVIGEWLGKPLYRKVLIFTNTSNISLNISNLEIFTDIKVILKSNSNQWRTLPWLYNNGGSALGSATWLGGFYITPDNALIFQVGTDLEKISYGHIILEYTKTTD